MRHDLRRVRIKFSEKEKKAFEEDRDCVPCAMNKSHAFVRASSPICMALFIAPIPRNRLSSSKEKKASNLWRLKKASPEKHPDPNKGTQRPQITQIKMGRQ